MKTVKKLSQDVQDWMQFLGEFDITVNGDLLKGYMEGGKVYLSPQDLRELAVACQQVADYMEAA